MDWKYWETEYKDMLCVFLTPDERCHVEEMVMSAPFFPGAELDRDAYSRGLNMGFHNVFLMEASIAWPDEWTDRFGGVWVLHPDLRVLHQKNGESPGTEEKSPDQKYAMAVGMLDAWKALAID